ncbi:hypothetical protein DENIT_12085 [Pseudomonas veronii]|nr:hypothetical protein DENIT_12085 [Pseudomonas veronii]
MLFTVNYSPPSLMQQLKCTNQLVFRAIIEHNGHWRIDDFLATAHHRFRNKTQNTP